MARYRIVDWQGHYYVTHGSFGSQAGVGRVWTPDATQASSFGPNEATALATSLLRDGLDVRVEDAQG